MVLRAIGLQLFDVHSFVVDCNSIYPLVDAYSDLEWTCFALCAQSFGEAYCISCFINIVCNHSTLISSLEH
jgi:hypothetical protein